MDNMFAEHMSRYFAVHNAKAKSRKAKAFRIAKAVLSRSKNFVTAGRPDAALYVDEARVLGTTKDAKIDTPVAPTDGGTFTDATNMTLFGTISEADLVQTSLGDCYIRAALMCVIRENKNYLQKIIFKEKNNSGSYTGRIGVLFIRNNVITVVFVKSAFSGKFGNLSSDKDYWDEVFLMAYAHFRTGADTYASLNYGFQGNVLSDIGLSYSLAQISLDSLRTCSLTLRKANVTLFAQVPKLRWRLRAMPT